MEGNTITGVIDMKEIIKAILDKPGSTSMILTAVAEVLSVLIDLKKKGS